MFWFISGIVLLNIAPLTIFSCAQSSKLNNDKVSTDSTDINDSIFNNSAARSINEFENFFKPTKEEEIANQEAITIFNKIFQSGNFEINKNKLANILYDSKMTYDLIFDDVLKKLSLTKEFIGYSVDEDMSIINNKNESSYIVQKSPNFDFILWDKISFNSQQIWQNKQFFKYKGKQFFELNKNQQQEFLIQKLQKNNQLLLKINIPTYIEYKLKKINLLSSDEFIWQQNETTLLEDIVKITSEYKLLIRKYNINDFNLLHENANKFLINHFDQFFVFQNEQWEPILKNKIHEKILNQWNILLANIQEFHQNFNYNISKEPLKLLTKETIYIQIYPDINNENKWNNLDLQDKLKTIKLLFTKTENIDYHLENLIENIDIKYNDKTKNWIFHKIIWNVTTDKYSIFNDDEKSFLDLVYPNKIKVFQHYKLAWISLPKTIINNLKNE